MLFDRAQADPTDPTHGVISRFDPPRAAYLVRPATPAERVKVAASWRTMLTLPSHGRDPDAGQVLVGLGSRDASLENPTLIRAHKHGLAIGREFLRGALDSAVDVLLDSIARVLVADHPSAPGLPLGWVAFEAPEAFEGPEGLAGTPQLLAVHVTRNARKAHVGRTLLRYALEQAGVDAPCALMTDAGRRLLGHVRAEMGKGQAA